MNFDTGASLFAVLLFGMMLGAFLQSWVDRKKSKESTSRQISYDEAEAIVKSVKPPEGSGFSFALIRIVVPSFVNPELKKRIGDLFLKFGMDAEKVKLEIENAILAKEQADKKERQEDKEQSQSESDKHWANVRSENALARAHEERMTLLRMRIPTKEVVPDGVSAMLPVHHRNMTSQQASAASSPAPTSQVKDTATDTPEMGKIVKTKIRQRARVIPEPDGSVVIEPAKQPKA